MRKKKVLDFLSKSDIIKIATITTLVFAFTHFLKISAMLDGSAETPAFDAIHRAISLPNKLSAWLHQPWSILSFMFSAEGFINLLFDLIWLWIFGTVIEDLKGMYRVLPIYLLGGFVGGILYLISGSLVSGPTIYYLGVLPSVIAVVVASITYNPQFTYWFYNIKIKIWMLGAFFLLLKIGTLGNYSIGNLLLIGGGVLVGILYGYGGIFIFDWMTTKLKKIASFFGNDNFVEKKKSKIPMHIHQTSANRMDEILDKISQKGMNALSSAEKKYLEAYSKDSIVD